MKNKYLQVIKIILTVLIVLTLFFSMFNYSIYAIVTTEDITQTKVDNEINGVKNYLTSQGYDITDCDYFVSVDWVYNNNHFYDYIISNTPVEYYTVGDGLRPMSSGKWFVVRNLNLSGSYVILAFGDSTDVLTSTEKLFEERIFRYSSHDIYKDNGDLAFNGIIPPLTEPTRSIKASPTGDYYEIIFDNLDDVASIKLTVSGAPLNGIFGPPNPSNIEVLEIIDLPPTISTYIWDSRNIGWIGSDAFYQFDVTYTMKDDTTLEVSAGHQPLNETTVIKPSFSLTYDPSDANWYLKTNYANTYKVVFNRWGHVETQDRIDIKTLYENTFSMDKGTNYRLLEEPLSRIYSYELYVISEDGSEIYARILFDRDLMITNDCDLLFDINYQGKSYEEVLSHVTNVNYEGSVSPDEYGNIFEDVTINNDIPSRGIIQNVNDGIETIKELGELSTQGIQLFSVIFSLLGSIQIFAFIFAVIISIFTVIGLLYAIAIIIKIVF